MNVMNSGWRVCEDMDEESLVHEGVVNTFGNVDCGDDSADNYSTGDESVGEDEDDNWERN